VMPATLSMIASFRDKGMIMVMTMGELADEFRNTLK